MSLASALLAFQSEAKTLPKDKTGKVQMKSGGSYEYRYTDLHTIVETITPLLAKHGLTWTTRPTGTHEAPTLTYELLWEGQPEPEDQGGIWREAIAGEMPLFLPEQPTSQTLGSAITYARRYALTAVLNLVADEDDDGQAASPPRASYGRQKGPYNAAEDNGREATKPQKGKVRGEATKAGLKDADAWLDFTKQMIGRPVKVDELTFDQASFLIDRLQQGAIPTGKSDLPEDAPEHEKAPQDETLPFEAT
jgi:hypothetical protein